MKLIIVESPNKIKTITKIMGSGYEVLATVGHIMIIDNVGLYHTGIDTKNGFKISYIFDPKKKEILKKIKDEAKKADEIFVCSDDDREGHKISDEVRLLLKDYKSKLKRAVFNEITPKAVKYGIEHPIPFDENMIQAAEARATVDRLVGYRLSPLAKSKVGCDSAGRVQSALLRLICEKEKTILDFKSAKYWEVYLDFIKEKKLTAKVYQIDKRKAERLDKESDVDKVLSDCDGKDFVVDKITSKTKQINSKPPLITAALQQIASNVLGYSPSKTQTTAQHLFEKGYITYIRVDAERYSAEFTEKVKDYIGKNYGDEYYQPFNAKNDNRDAQDAHESIHPTDLENTPGKISSFLDPTELKLYKLIYNYSIAALMVPAEVKVSDIIISCGKYKFKITGKEVIKESFLKLYGDYENDILPEFKTGEKLKKPQLRKEEKETQPPQRYSEAGLVKLMQETGIGRPSSYSTVIETLKKREYIEIQKKAVYATEKGIRLNDLLVKYFPTFINTEYTSNMEKELDKISVGEAKKLDELNEFWATFEPLVKTATKEANKDKEKPELVGRKCPDCGKELVYRIGKQGKKFIACSGFPRCHHTETIDGEMITKPKPIDTGIICPKCKTGKLVERSSKRGKFYGCSNYPKCHEMMVEKEFEEYKKSIANKNEK